MVHVRRWKLGLARVGVLASLFWLVTIHAQTVGAEPAGLKAVFDAAWTRQPAALALAARRDAANAQQRVARSWTPEPAALALSTKGDRPGRHQGSREFEVGLAAPIWLPGERAGSAALAQAEMSAIDSRIAAAQLRLAASVREAWWLWQRARSDALAASELLENHQRIAADVARRAKAGELARADQHQAEGAVAAAQAVRAQAAGAAAAARLQLQALAGAPLDTALDDLPARAADRNATPPEVETHAALSELKDRIAVAQRTAALSAMQTRANPELTLAATHARGAPGEASAQTVTLGVRIPFSAGPRVDARGASARAEVIEAQALLAHERARLLAERESASVLLDAAREQLTAAERRAQLALESRGFFDKSFRLGETDLPTRLRVEAEATEAQRQAARSRIELAAATSLWRQALGLLP